MYRFPNQLKKITFALVGIGFLGVVYAMISVHGIQLSNVTQYIPKRMGTYDPNHLEDFVHQLHNKPWSALYLAIFFFTSLSLVSLFFLAVQHAAQVGWSVVVFRVMEAIASFLPVGGMLLFLMLLASSGHLNHIFHWMDPQLTHKWILADGSLSNTFETGAKENHHFDAIIFGKVAYLNTPFFLMRAFIYIAGWVGFYFWITSLSHKLDITKDLKYHRRLRDVSAGFLVFFAVTSSMMSWDWVMSIDPHWFSTLFGWYAFSSYLTVGIATIILISVFLKKSGYLPYFNHNHLHDLTKYLFGFSMLWAYLWFSQFLLIWYANIPEEVTYYIARFDWYVPITLGMLIPNLLIPFLMLVSSTVKRWENWVCVAAVIVCIGHYMDMYNMIMPGSVGAFWSIGVGELSAMLLLLGLFVWVVFRQLSKINLAPKGNPYFKESKDYHYPF